MHLLRFLLWPAMAAKVALANEPFHLEAMFPLTAGDFVVGRAAKLGVEAAFSQASDWIQPKVSISAKFQ